MSVMCSPSPGNPQRKALGRVCQSGLRFAGGGFEASNPDHCSPVIEETKAMLGADFPVHSITWPSRRVLSRRVTEGLGATGSWTTPECVRKALRTSRKGSAGLMPAVTRSYERTRCFRIDHFLGKEGAQDLLAAAIRNGLFDGVWSREHVAAVQIDVPRP